MAFIRLDPESDYGKPYQSLIEAKKELDKEFAVARKALEHRAKQRVTDWFPASIHPLATRQGFYDFRLMECPEAEVRLKWCGMRWWHPKTGYEFIPRPGDQWRGLTQQ